MYKTKLAQLAFALMTVAFIAAPAEARTPSKTLSNGCIQYSDGSLDCRNTQSISRLAPVQDAVVAPTTSVLKQRVLLETQSNGCRRYSDGSIDCTTPQ